ncbi:MAG TPA: S9 family peptidase, partial [Phaeodactylibacter sp.]|nr:S9 family peptidase [Phaeodactylibacter sp.]
MQNQIEISQQQNDLPLPGDPNLVTPAEELASLIRMGEGKYKYSVEDFFRTPEKTAYKLSPDGKYISFLGTYKRRQNIFIQKIGEDTSIRITSETERDISSYFWANNNRLLYIKDSSGDENFKLFAVDKDGNNSIDLSPFDKVRIQLIDKLEDSPDEVIIGMNKNMSQLFEPYRINIVTGEYQQLAHNTNPLEPVDRWMTDHKGKLRIATKIVGGTNTVLMYRAHEEEDFKEVMTTDFRVRVSPLFFDFDNKSIVYVSSNLHRDKSVIIRFDMKTGKEVGDIIFQHPDVDVSELYFSKKRKVLTSVAYNTEKYHFHYLDEHSKIIAQRLKQALGNYERWITGKNRNEDKLIIRTFSDRSLGAYYLYDVENDHLDKITDVSPW